MNKVPDKYNVLGIFGILKQDQENFFQELQTKCSKFSGDELKNVFNHLSLVIHHDVQATKLNIYLNLLKDLKSTIPLYLDVLSVEIKDENNMALVFDLKQTEEIRNIVNSTFLDVIATNYMKVVRSVPLNKQKEVMKELKSIKKLEIEDFVLISTALDKKNSISSSIKS